MPAVVAGGPAPVDDLPLQSIGEAARYAGLCQRLWEPRTAEGLSLAALATRSGLSISFLSAAECGQSNISVGSRFKVADALGTRVPGLAAETRSDGRGVVRPEDRPRYVAGGGRMVIEDLLVGPGALEAQRIEIRPDGGSEDPYAHPGEEFVYVLTGRITFWIDEHERHDLTPGDALYFRSTRPHRWCNEGDEPATVLWINVPVVDSATSGAAGRRTAKRRPNSTVTRRAAQGSADPPVAGIENAER